MKNRILLLLFAALSAGCGSKKSSGTPEVAAGSGTIAGGVGGQAFATVGAAYHVGSPDDPATSVVYLFSNPILCSEITSTGWDGSITDGTDILEIKAVGTAAAVYPVSSLPTAPSGDASVNYTLSSTTGTPVETIGTSGSVTFTTLTGGASATGSFTIGFAGSSLTGTFDAAFCAAGREP